ncbi:aminotransferase class IV family protein [Georgenia sp. TF02-10]|uniref:aminotransferase class IV family protein n=1 Tax=Georgenia sp. TF02-10 TaxID=2917725 RepID=UPI001FA6F6DC|nr:aminotransferase class IV family protein [Georgenia sp. TF02-10]UNX55187.1 aminotransferase class IV family protein [Georgenia sp. TF02-10]
MAVSITHLNGRPASTEDLAPLAFAGFAHFTAMQVRDRAVRGLDLHLARLRSASHELFGAHLPEERLREHLLAALSAAPADVSLTCFITSRPGEFVAPDGGAELDVLVKVTDPADPPLGPLSLDLVEHERHLPTVKHVGEVSKTLYLRRAHARGFDDAAFVDRSGRLSEATIWNLAFWDGNSVIWPKAAVLPGVTMQILSRRLHALGVAQRTRPVRPEDLTERLAAVVLNSWTPAVPVARIGEHRLGDGSEIVRLLHRAYETEPIMRVQALSTS